MIGQRAGALVDVRPKHEALAMTLRLDRDVAENLDEGLKRILARLHADFAQRPGLIKPDVVPRAREELRRLRYPVVKHREHTRVARVELIAVTRQSEVRELLDSE